MLLLTYIWKTTEKSMQLLKIDHEIKHIGKVNSPKEAQWHGFMYIFPKYPCDITILQII